MAEDLWQVQYDGWREDWHRTPGGGFDGVAIGPHRYDTAQDDVSALRPKTAQACPVCRGVLPGAFSYCFKCGARLHDAPAPAEPPHSVPNAGRPSAGLPGLRPAGETTAPLSVSLPTGRLFGFALAGRPVRLFAIDRDLGWLFEYDRIRTSWKRLICAGEIALPEASWSVGAHGDGIVIAASGRLTVIDLKQPIPAELPRLTFAPGDSPAAGPAIVRDEALVPILRAGALHLARHAMGQGSDWTVAPVAGDWHIAGAGVPVFLSAPMATEDQVSWAGTAGYVVAGMSDGGAFGQPSWHNWNEGFAPLLSHRPYVDSDGQVWQFGSTPLPGGRRTACFEHVGPQSHARQERVGGSVLANGVLACRLLTLRHRAWVEESPFNRDLPGQTNEYLVPVQALNTKCCVLAAAPDRLSDFVSAGEAGLSSPILASLRFYDGERLYDLARPVGLRSIQQLAAFVFDARLYVYDRFENECTSWQMEQVPTSRTSGHI
jgi:hypothetical protein